MLIHLMHSQQVSHVLDQQQVYIFVLIPEHQLNEQIISLLFLPLIS